VPASQATIQKQPEQNSAAVARADEVSALEKMVKEEESKQQNVQKAAVVAKPAPVQSAPATQAKSQERAIQKAASATTGKTLSQEDLAKIAALVAQELAKARAVPAKANSSTTTNAATASQNDAALAAQLESAEVDTLKNQENITPQKLEGNVKAGSSKKVDTFNKVVVADNGGSDELSKLSQEIDSILQSEEVSQKQNSEIKTYTKELSKEAVQRENEMRFIVVKKGDTLSSIANRAYGRASAYVKIYKANPDVVRNPHKIYVGMRLRVPVDEEYKKQQGK